MVAALLAVGLVLAATFVYAGVAAGSDAYRIGRGFDISHLWQGRERAATLAGFVVCAYAVLLYLRFPHWWAALAPVAAFGAGLCLFGLRFDIRLNLRRLLPRYYLGTDPQTAATDKLLRAKGLTGQTAAWLKLAGVVALAAAAYLLSV